MAEFDSYITAWRERRARDERARVEARERAMALARELADVLITRYGATRVVLVGSLARGDLAPGSDIGLAAEGGGAWHRELLQNMTLDLPGIRPPVIAPATAAQLAEFLPFRHLFWSLYGFERDWSRLRTLLARLPGVWTAPQPDLQRFVGFLDLAARSS